MFSILLTQIQRRVLVKAKNSSTLLLRNVRFLWLALVFMPPGVAFLAYCLTPHERVWHDVLYSLFCLPLFGIWLVALLGCVVSFLLHRLLART